MNKAHLPQKQRLITQLELGVPAGFEFKLGLLVASLQALSAVALMGFSAWLISRAAEQPPVMYLMVAVVAVRGFALGRASFRYVERLLLHNAAFKLMAELRPTLFAKLIPLAPAGLGANRSEVVTRLVNDVDETQNLSLRILSPIFQSGAVLLVTVGYLYFQVPYSALVIMLWCLAAILIALPLSTWLANRTNRSLAQERAMLNDSTMTLIENIDVLQAFGWLPAQLNQINSAQKQLNRAARMQALSAGVGQSLFLICAAFATGGSVYFAAKAQANLLLDPRMLAVFALVPIAVFDTLTALQPVLGLLQRYRVSANRVLEVLQSEPSPELCEPISATGTPNGFRSLELNKVSIRYPLQNKLAVQNISLQITPGQNLLIAGPSGAGKSSVASVLLGLLNPVDGEYLVNGLPRQLVAGDELRKLVGYQEQNPTIFSGSLRTNLLLAKPEATDADLWQVLERVKLASMFEQRQGLQTELGERGFAISGGEAQRIALARMFLANFAVMIFDEPTSSVDPETAKELVGDLVAIAKADSTRACIFISHDPQFLGLVDNTLRI